MDRKARVKVMLLHPDGYERVPRGHEPDRYRAIEDGLRSAGHEFIGRDRTDDLDLLLFNSGVWHLNHRDGAVCGYDWHVIWRVLEGRIPVVWFDDFDRCPAPEPWSWAATLGRESELSPASTEAHWHRFAREIIARDHPVLYFMRKMQKLRDYPPWVLPLEYPLFVDLPLDSKDQFLSRPFDVCGIANISYPRAHAFIGLMRAPGIKSDCEVRPHYRRISSDAFIARHRAARFFVEADASLGSERPMVLSTVSAMLRISSQHRLPFERQDLVHQLELGDYDGWIRDEDVQKLRLVLADGDLCYSIYVQGAEFMRTNYSLAARTRYVIENLERWMAGRG